MRKIFWYWHRWCWWKYNLQNHLIFVVTHANVNLCAAYEVCPTVSEHQHQSWKMPENDHFCTGGVTTIFPMNKILVAVCWLRSRNFSMLWYWKHEWLARDPPHGRYQIDGVQPDIANRTRKCQLRRRRTSPLPRLLYFKGLFSRKIEPPPWGHTGKSFTAIWMGF